MIGQHRTMSKVGLAINTEVNVPLSGRSACVQVNDVLDELSHENKRLAEELKIANEFLDKIKTLLTKVYEKYDETFDIEDKQDFNKLTEEMVEINKKLKESVIESPISLKVGSTQRSHTNKLMKNKIKKARAPHGSISQFRMNKGTKAKSKRSRIPPSYEIIALTRKQRELCFDPINNYYKCPQSLCHKTFAANSYLRKHLQSCHVEPWISCTVDGCEAKFTTERYLQQHLLQKHSNDKPFVCPYDNCSKAFKIKSLLNYHLKAHSDHKEFQCPHCQYETHMKSVYLSHMKKHTTFKPFQCQTDGCGKLFKTQYALKDHESDHIRDLFFECTYEGCDKQFKRQSTMKYHLKKYHLYKDRDFKTQVCDWPGCEFKTESKSKLEMHKTLHTGELRYVCDWTDCGKRFRLKKGLKEHLNVHTNSKPHECNWPGCQYRTAFNANLVKHTKHVHKISRLSKLPKNDNCQV